MSSLDASSTRNLRFGLLTVEGIDLTSSEHIGQNKVLEHLYSLWRPSFVVVSERLEEIFARSIPLTYGKRFSLYQDDGKGYECTFSHPHLAATLFDNSHDARMRDCRSDVIGGVVDFLSNRNCPSV